MESGFLAKICFILLRGSFSVKKDDILMSLDFFKGEKVMRVSCRGEYALRVLSIARCR